jgi:hypothetical protein
VTLDGRMGCWVRKVGVLGVIGMGNHQGAVADKTAEGFLFCFLEDRRKDFGQLSRFLGKVFPFLFHARVVRDIHQVEPILALSGFLAGDPDTKREILFAQGLVGLDDVGADGAGGVDQLPAVLVVGDGFRHPGNKDPHVFREGVSSLRQVKGFGFGWCCSGHKIELKVICFGKVCFCFVRRGRVVIDLRGSTKKVVKTLMAPHPNRYWRFLTHSKTAQGL